MRIDDLRRTRNAVILAHNYQIPEIQDLADHVGDSLELAQQAAATDKEVIVFCGVRFMAETAAILDPRPARAYSRTSRRIARLPGAPPRTASGPGRQSIRTPCWSRT